MFDHSPKPKFFQYPLESHEEAVIRNRLKSLQIATNSKIYPSIQLRQADSRQHFRHYISRLELKLSIINQQIREKCQIIALHDEIEEKSKSKRDEKSERKSKILQQYQNIIRQKKGKRMQQKLKESIKLMQQFSREKNEQQQSLVKKEKSMFLNPEISGNYYLFKQPKRSLLIFGEKNSQGKQIPYFQQNALDQNARNNRFLNRSQLVNKSAPQKLSANDRLPQILNSRIRHHPRLNKSQFQ